jgi:leader peptidase (prepilin peptidase) / N-methyltransferase
VRTETLVAVGFCWVVLVLSVTDLERRRIPNRIVLPAAAVVLAAQTALRPGPQWAVGALGAGGLLLAAALAYPAGLGMGDVKLALLLGAMLGRTVPLALFVGLVAASFLALALLIRHGARARKMAIPFGPFLAIGAIVALLAGQGLPGV